MEWLRNASQSYMKRSMLLGPMMFGMLCGVAPVAIPQLDRTVQGEDWTKFRGPNSDGVPAQMKQGIPVTWSEEENLVWKTPLPGMGASSPVLYKGVLYVTSHDGYGTSKDNPGDMSALVRKLTAIDAKSGKVLWQTSEASTAQQEPFASFTLLHGYASGTPAVDESGIYVFYGTTGTVAYDLQGKKKWSASCGTGTHVFGTANSPVLYKDLVIVNASVESQDLIALDKNTGKEVWKVSGMDSSWNTPIVVSLPERDELVLSIKGKVLAYDPQTGKMLWSANGIPDYICPSVFARDGIVYACGGRKNTILAIRAGGNGDVTSSNIVWRLDKGSNVSSPILLEDRLYWVSEGKGIAYCADAKTGKMIYEERIDPKPDRFYASPVAADGNIFYVSRIDGTYVVPASTNFKITAVNEFKSDESLFNGSPVIDSGRMYLRSDKFLYCIGTK